MDATFTRRHYEESASAIRSVAAVQPRIGIILGSGLSALAEAVESPVAIEFRDIPHFAVSTIPGHQGRLVLGMLHDKPVAVMQGRVHYYEGYSMQQVTLPVRVLRELGVNTLVVTNAAGGLNKAFRAGDLMLIVDHINLVGMTGANPLRGPNDPTLGPRFPDMSTAYDRTLRRLAKAVAQEADLPMHQGVYAGLTGPTFETPADIRFLRLIGADAVGMSTVPEVIVARHGGMRVLGVSGISNVAIDQIDAEAETSHEEVLEAGKLVTPRMTTLIKGVLAQLQDS
jgi:purine-nucleoside phosphorylase